MDEQEQGRVAVVTGVGGTVGIGFAIARRLLDDGYRVLVHPLAGAPLDALGGPSGRLRAVEADLGVDGPTRRYRSGTRLAPIQRQRLGHR